MTNIKSRIERLEEMLLSARKLISTEDKFQIIEEIQFQDVDERIKEILTQLSQKYKIPAEELKKDIFFMVLSDLSKPN